MTDHAADQRRYVKRHKEEALYKLRRKKNGELYKMRHPEKVKEYRRQYYSTTHK
jgi:hypothetical protein